MKHDKFLPKSVLVDGTYYKGSCRNAEAAVWDAEHNLFWYIRSKFGDHFPEDICHPEDDNGYDLFYPFETTLPTEEEKVDLVSVKKSHRDLLIKRAEWKKKNESRS